MIAKPGTFIDNINNIYFNENEFKNKNIYT